MAREVNFHNVAFERAQRYIDRPRLVIGLCAAVAVALIAAIPGLLSSDDSGRSVRTQAFAQEAPTTTEAPGAGVVTPFVVAPPTAFSQPTSTTMPAAVLGATFTRPTTTAARKPAPKPAATSATTLPPRSAPPTPTCHNSYDPACGPFSWSPDPGPNQAMTGQVTSDPPMPKAGDTVNFHVTASDPDATPLVVCNADYGQGEQGFVCDPRPKMDPTYCRAQYGPWSPPARQPGNLDTVAQHKYANPGRYNVSFTINSAQEECNNPYASTITLTTTVVA